MTKETYLLLGTGISHSGWTFGETIDVTSIDLILPITSFSSKVTNSYRFISNNREAFKQ